MEGGVCILGVPGSPVATAVARRLDKSGVPARTLALDAPLRGEAITIRPGAVLWQGCDLARASAVLVERPVFPWPQPQRIGELLRDGAPEPGCVNAERESRSLLVSALFAAAEQVPVLNAPFASHLAAAPAIALERLAREGIPVHPWRLTPIPASAARPRPFRDAVGPEFWHRPLPPDPGEPALCFDPVPGRPLSLLVVGGEVRAGLAYADSACWEEDRSPVLLPSEDVPPASTALAGRAADLLDLAFATVSIVTGSRPPRVLSVEAGPDLEIWHTRTNGAASESLADHLVSLSARDEGATEG